MKLFKKNLFILLFLISAINTQDITGNYRLSGLSVVYYDFIRQNSEINITNNNGICSGIDCDALNMQDCIDNSSCSWEGIANTNNADNTVITTIGDTYEQGEAVSVSYQVPSPESIFPQAGVRLYVNFYGDGTAAIAQGSSYPTTTTENCITSESSLPISGNQIYTSNLNSDVTIPDIDIIGLPSKSIYAGQASGSCSISSSPVFDIFPEIATELTIPFPINTLTISEELGQLIPENSILPGKTAGYALLDRKMVSIVEKNAATRPSLYLEWHAIDGPVNDSGLGDIIGVDEDGDGTDYDSIYGLEAIGYTKIKLDDECGSARGNNIAGRNIEEELRNKKQQQCDDAYENDNCNIFCGEGLNCDDIVQNCESNNCETLSENWITNCVESNHSDTLTTNVYALEPNPIASIWGGIMTWNSYNANNVYETEFTSCLSQGIDSATCYSIATHNDEYLAFANEDDSDHAFNNTCLTNGDDSDCSGALTFSYTPQCLSSFSVRYFMAELTELCSVEEIDECGVCNGDGAVHWYNDADGDGLGDPNNYRLNCLPGYCVEDENLNIHECMCSDYQNGYTYYTLGGTENCRKTDGIDDDGNIIWLTNENLTGNQWEWLSMGICSTGAGNEIPNMTAETCNNFSEDNPEYNITWSWDRSFTTNGSDPDDSCINIDEYHSCNGDCNTNIDECGVCNGGGLADGACDCDGNVDLGCGCGNPAPDECETCDGSIVNLGCGCGESGISEGACDCDGNVDLGCGCGEEAATENYDCDGICMATGENLNNDGYDCNDVCGGTDTSCLSIDKAIPTEFEISSAYPNPFNPVITISYGIPTSQYTEGHIYNLNGVRVGTLVSQHQPAGNYSVKWNATGKSSGIYIFILKTESEVKSQKLVLLK